MRKKDFLSIFFTIFIIGFFVFYYINYLKIPEPKMNIYVYSTNDEETQNKDILLNFIQDSNNHLTNSFYMMYSSNFEENIIYGR